MAAVLLVPLAGAPPDRSPAAAARRGPRPRRSTMLPAGVIRRSPAGSRSRSASCAFENSAPEEGPGRFAPRDDPLRRVGRARTPAVAHHDAVRLLELEPRAGGAITAPLTADLRAAGTDRTRRLNRARSKPETFAGWSGGDQFEAPRRWRSLSRSTSASLLIGVGWMKSPQPPLPRAVAAISASARRWGRIWSAALSNRHCAG